MISQETILKAAETAVANLSKQLQDTKNSVLHIEGAIEGIRLFAAELQKHDDAGAEKIDAGQQG